MRKVYIEGEATVMVPVRVKFSMTVRADADASIAKALKLASRVKTYAKADVEDIAVDEVLGIGNYDGTEELDAAIQEAFEFSPFTIHNSQVIDSK